MIIIHVVRTTNLLKRVETSLNEVYQIAETCIFSFAKRSESYDILSDGVSYKSVVPIYLV